MRMIRIPLVQGDGRPLIEFRIDDANTRQPVRDLANSTVTAGMLFREVGGEELIADISLSKVNDGYDALVLLDFWRDDEGKSWLDGLSAGMIYEGQLYLDFDGRRQTVQTQIKFLIKEAFDA